ncbi:MAG: hypothetical protein ACODAE_07135, partial [Gemmatimonadota bacterium]
PTVDGPVPAPAAMIPGYGADRPSERAAGGAGGARPPRWAEVTAYLEALAAASPRVRLDTLGRTTLDRPFVLATVASPATLADLELYRSVQQRFADPWSVRSNDELAHMLAAGRTVVLVAGSGRAGARARDRGAAGRPVSDPLRIAYRLASGDGRVERTILANTIVLALPSLNPDGFDRVAEWLDERGGETVTEGFAPPILEHAYAGRGDLRADLPGLTQIETRLVIERVVRAWNPHAVHGIEPDDARPATGSWGAGAGRGARADTVRGRSSRDPGATGALPWPARFSPLAAGIAPMRAHGDPIALLEEAATERERWLWNGWDAARRAVVARSDDPPAAWGIIAPRPGGSSSSSGLAELLRILDISGVELHRAAEPFELGDAARRTVAAGTYLVPGRQPRAGLARWLLGGPADDAGVLPRLLGVDIDSIRLSDREMRDLSARSAIAEVASVRAPRRIAPGLTGAGSAAPRIAVYRSRAPASDEGWVRWVLDAYRIPHITVADRQIRRGGVAARADVVVFPDQHPDTIYAGHARGTVPAGNAGGLGAEGTAALAEFVRAGGSLVTLGRATRYATEYLGIPVRDRDLDARASCAESAMSAGRAGPPPTPSSRTARAGTGERERIAAAAQALPQVVPLEVDTTHPLGAHSSVHVRAWVDGALALEPEGAAARGVARYGPDATTGCRTDGYAFVETSAGAGRVVAFGFRPHHRGIAVTTLPLFFNALRAGAGPPQSPSSAR